MIFSLIKKCMFAIAKMSKKASLIYLIILVTCFLISLTFVTIPLIILTNGQSTYPPFTIPMLVVGSVMAVLIILSLAITSISSNYVKKQQNRDETTMKIESNN